MKNSGYSLKKRLASFRYAFQGLRRLFASEANAWIHLFAAVCVIIAGFLLSLAVWEWIVIVLVIGAVFVAEAFNSSLEALCDKVCVDYNDSIKNSKDLAAAAVLLTAITAIVVGLIIFVPKIIALFVS